MLQIGKLFAGRPGRGGSVGRALEAVLLGVGAMVLAQPAEAQWERKKAPKPTPKQTRSAPAEIPRPAADSPLLALISIGSQRLHVWDRNGLVTTAPVSSGRSGHETPQGVFSVIEKKEEHVSNLYEDASMPFMQRITWSGVAMHAGALPGYPASHGCVRLPQGFARTWFDMTKLNTRVIITPHDAAPVSITHPALFQPQVVARDAGDQPAAAEPVRRGRPGTRLRPVPAFTGEDGSVDSAMMLGARPERPDAPDASRPHLAPPKGVVTPAQAARAARAAAEAKVAASSRAADTARLSARQKQADWLRADRVGRDADAAHKRGLARLAAADRSIAKARTEDQRAKARFTRAVIADELAVLATTASERRLVTDRLGAEAREAEAAAKSAEQERTAAQAAARDAARLVEPVSVFVSRATQRVYIRQAREPVLDLPVTVAQPGKPIGTHVFTAMSSSDGGVTLQWNVVTVEPAAIQRTPLPANASRKERLAQSKREPAPDARTQAAALGRITFPQEVLDRVSPYLLVGSSLIVSDLGPSFETGNGTDFIVQTRGEEEARESVRRIIAEKRIEKNKQRSSERQRWASSSQRWEAPRWESSHRWTASRQGRWWWD